jgi:hypothetical protein
MKTSVINQIKTLLGMEVKLETMKLMDGITIFEADAFEMDNEVFIVTEDEQKIPVPIGEYELEDGRVLVVEVEGIILEIKEVATEEEVVEEEAPAVEVEVEAEATPSAKKTIESVVKETFFAEIEKLTNENIELKAQLEKQQKEELEKKIVEKAIKVKKKQIKKQQVLDEISSEEEIIIKKKEKPAVKKSVENITVKLIPFM